MAAFRQVPTALMIKREPVKALVVAVGFYFYGNSEGRRCAFVKDVMSYSSNEDIASILISSIHNFDRAPRGYIKHEVFKEVFKDKALKGVFKNVHKELCANLLGTRKACSSILL